MTDTQRDFQKFASNRGWSAVYIGDGHYESHSVQFAFEAWQAATAQAEAEKAELVRKCAEICDSQGKEWDSDDVVIDKNYAHVCRDAILSLLPNDKRSE